MEGFKDQVIWFRATIINLWLKAEFQSFKRKLVVYFFITFFHFSLFSLPPRRQMVHSLVVIGTSDFHWEIFRLCCRGSNEVSMIAAS